MSHIKDNKEVEIETNIKMPKYDGRSKYPWEELEIGDSFLLDSNHHRRSGYEMAAERSRRSSPKQFKARKVEQGTRIWRIA